jgi:hypothetical protein
LKPENLPDDAGADEAEEDDQGTEEDPALAESAAAHSTRAQRIRRRHTDVDASLRRSPFKEQQRRSVQRKSRRPGADVMKRFFFFVTDGRSNRTCLFAPNRPCRPSLMFVGKARSLP